MDRIENKLDLLIDFKATRAANVQSAGSDFANSDFVQRLRASVNPARQQMAEDMVRAGGGEYVIQSQNGPSTTVPSLYAVWSQMQDSGRFRGTFDDFVGAYRVSGKPGQLVNESTGQIYSPTSPITILGAVVPAGWSGTFEDFERLLQPDP